MCGDLYFKMIYDFLFKIGFFNIMKGNLLMKILFKLSLGGFYLL